MVVTCRVDRFLLPTLIGVGELVNVVAIRRFRYGPEPASSRKITVMENVDSARLTEMLLHYEIVEFLTYEVELLDARRFKDWLALLTDDVVYRMPLRLNVQFGQEERAVTSPGSEVCWFDDDRATLESRVDQILTGVHWAEEPASRATHMVSNIRVVERRPPEVTVSSAFLTYRNRVEAETDILVGRRSDTLTKESGRWQLRRREVTLDQNVLQAKNLTLIV